MYYVIYMDVLREGKTLKDLKALLEEKWSVHEGWGAKKMDVYTPLYGEAGVVYVRYELESLDEWNKGITSKEGEELVKDLDKVIDVKQTYIEVNVSAS